MLQIGNSKHIYLASLRDNYFLAEAELGIILAPPPVEVLHREPLHIVTTLTQQGTERVEEWQFADLLAPEIKRPQYTSINFPRVQPAAMSPNGKRSYKRRDNYARE